MNIIKEALSGQKIMDPLDYFITKPIFANKTHNIERNS